MKLWLDDYRNPPVGWYWAKNYDKCIMFLETGKVEEISLDHDLADMHYAMESTSDYMSDPYAGAEKTGYHVVLWMLEHQVFPSVIRIHSASPVGRERMFKSLENHVPDDVRLILMGPGEHPDGN